MHKILLILLIIFTCAFPADPNNTSTPQVSEQNISTERLGRVGNYGYPNNPTYDRAKGYLLGGKVKNAVSNHGNFVTWDYHPAGFWSGYGYLPHIGFVAGVPGHEYSSAWSSPGSPSWLRDPTDNSLWVSTDAYNAWIDGIDIQLMKTNPKQDVGNFKTVVYNTVVNVGNDDRGHNDRADIAIELIDYCTNTDPSIFVDEVPNEDDCKDAGYQWIKGMEQLDLNSGPQWYLDHEAEKLYLYLEDSSLDPNYASDGIGLAFPWSIRPKFKSRTEISGGYFLDLYEYGDDQEEWTSDDIYTYFGATFAESWFMDDSPFGSPSIKSDWQASNQARFNTHNQANTAGDLFGNTIWTDSNDPQYLLAHSEHKSTWPTKYSFDAGSEEAFWPGWWADEYYGEAPDSWSTVGIYDCSGIRSDPGCWKPLKGRHISDMDVYMEFDDIWASVGNKVENNEYIAAGYPMGIKVMAMAHSYGVAYAEDVMFVTVKVRNESGDFCAFEKDNNEYEIPIIDENGIVVCDDGLILPDGTMLNRGKGFDYKKLFLGFYMDADVLSTDETGNTTVHSNADDFMKYIDCKISKEEYPDGCPVVNKDTLRISMALIGDYDGRSSTPSGGYSMATGENVGSDFGVVAVQLLDSPYSTGYVDLDEDGFYDIYPGEKLKMTDWHWFDWYNRPGVKGGFQTNDDHAQNKELMQYQVIAGDNTNLTTGERVRYFHTKNPATDYDSDINPHFDSLEGLKLTPFFTGGDAPGEGLDCVLEMSTGPFDLKVGEEVSFSFCVIYGQNMDDLLKNAYFAQIMYNSHYQGYTPPITPNVMARSGHEKIELFWDDASSQSRDVITGYSDFEGYKIYRSIDGGSTWGSIDEQILIKNAQEGWQPYSLGCIDNPNEEGGGSCTNNNLLSRASCEFAGFEWSYIEYDHGSDCSSFRSKAECTYSDATTFIIRDEDGDNINDCFWKYAQFDLSAYQDSLFCILGWDEETGSCKHSADCPRDCIRGVDVQGPDPEADWFNLGYNTGLDVIKIGMQEPPYNPDSVLTIPDDKTGKLISYKYKFVDDNVLDGVEYIYSVVAYDRGVPKEQITYNPTDGGDSLFVQEVASIPDPSGWGNINPFWTLESPKGTTTHDPNFVKVISGYHPDNNLNNIKVVPNPYIVHSDYNETKYKRRIRFTRLPKICTITIFTITGEKVRELNHNSSIDGNAWWDLRSSNNQEIAPGLYIYVVETPGGNKKIDKFAVVR